MALIYILTVVLYAGNPNIENRSINEKLLLGYSTEEEVGKEALLALKLYFQENTHLATLQEKNDLHFKTVRLGAYHVTVIYPIHSLALRNELLLNLSPLFSDMIAIDRGDEVPVAEAKAMKPLPQKAPKKKAKTTGVKKSPDPKPLNTDLSLKWLALALLSAIGLLLSIRNRKKLSRIKEGQKNMQNDQNIIEKQIHTLGVKNA